MGEMASKACQNALEGDFTRNSLSVHFRYTQFLYHLSYLLQRCWCNDLTKDEDNEELCAVQMDYGSSSKCDGSKVMTMAKV